MLLRRSWSRLSITNFWFMPNMRRLGVESQYTENTTESFYFLMEQIQNSLNLLFQKYTFLNFDFPFWIIKILNDILYKLGWNIDSWSSSTHSSYWELREQLTFNQIQSIEHSIKVLTNFHFLQLQHQWIDWERI